MLGISDELGVVVRDDWARDQVGSTGTVRIFKHFGPTRHLPFREVDDSRSNTVHREKDSHTAYSSTLKYIPRLVTAIATTTA